MVFILLKKKKKKSLSPIYSNIEQLQTRTTITLINGYLNF